jgi:hypothetical protein
MSYLLTSVLLLDEVETSIVLQFINFCKAMIHYFCLCPKWAFLVTAFNLLATNFLEPFISNLI